MTRTLYDRVGGSATIGAAVDLLHTKIRLDPALASWFSEVDTRRQSFTQKQLLVRAVVGGPCDLAELIESAHDELIAAGLGAVEFESLRAHIASTLVDLGVGEWLLNEFHSLSERFLPASWSKHSSVA